MACDVEPLHSIVGQPKDWGLPFLPVVPSEPDGCGVPILGRYLHHRREERRIGKMLKQSIEPLRRRIGQALDARPCLSMWPASSDEQRLAEMLGGCVHTDLRVATALPPISIHPDDHVVFLFLRTDSWDREDFWLGVRCEFGVDIEYSDWLLAIWRHMTTSEFFAYLRQKEGYRRRPWRSEPKALSWLRYVLYVVIACGSVVLVTLLLVGLWLCS